MGADWMVLIEVAAGCGEGTGVPDVQRLLGELADSEPVALFDPHRYALHLRVPAGGPVDALATALARWRAALARLDLAPWAVVRAEVVTPEERRREWELELAAPAGDCPPEAGPARLTAGETMLHHAFLDPVTGLVTAELFSDRVRLALARAQPRAVLLLDLRGFAEVNRQVGYAGGDRFLATIAARITGVAGPGATVARVGGDVFALLVPEPGAGALAEQLAEVVGVPVAVDGRSLSVGASIGVATTGTGADADELVQQAASALAAARRRDGGGAVRFVPGLAGGEGSCELFGSYRPPDRLSMLLLLQEAAAAANECATLDEAAVRVIRQVCAHTGWPLGHLLVPSPDGRSVRSTPIWHLNPPERYEPFRLASEGLEVPAGAGLPGRVLGTGAPYWVVDVGGDAGFCRAAAARASGIKAGLAFPVRVGGRVVAVLEFFSPVPVPPDDSLLEVMAAVGEQLGRVVERAEAQAAVAESEARYRALAESATDAIVSIDAAGVIVSWNRAAERIFGFTEAEALGRQVVLLVAPTPDEGAGCALATFLAGSVGRTVEIECRRSDGMVFPAEVSVSTWTTGAGRFYTGIFRDVTDRARAENELRRSEARFRALVHNSSEMITVIGPDAVVHAHYVGADVLGYGPDENLGRFGLEFVHPDDLAAAAGALAELLQGRAPSRPFECRVRHRDGSWRWLESLATDLRNDPAVGGIVVTSRDVTERKRAEEALEAARTCWRALLRDASQLVLLCDRDGTIQRAVPPRPSRARSLPFLEGWTLADLLALDGAPGPDGSQAVVVTVTAAAAGPGSAPAQS
jgi:PAS domain S-box-containing protein/diguanylate cyclase (GGDEF)-like protein